MASSSPQTTPRPSPRLRRRQRILDAAGQCFAASGFAKTTVEQIALRAGVSKGLVYHHFGGKEEILQAVLERTLAEWTDVSRIRGLAGADSVLEGIAAMHRSAIAYARDNPLLQALFKLDPTVVLDVARETVQDSLASFRAELVEALRVGVESGELRGDLDVERVTDVIRVLHLAFVDSLFNPEWIDVSDPEYVETTLDVLFHGIARRAS